MKKLLELAKKKRWQELAAELDGVKSLPKNGMPELFVRATGSGKLPLLRRLIALGADVNCRWNTYTPLGTAATLIDPAPIQFLLKQGASIDAPSFEDATPLICVAKFPLEWDIPELRPEALKTAKILLKAKPTVDAVDVVGRTALDYAFQSKWPELAKLLLAAGATVAACEDGGEQLLFHAVTAVEDDSLLKLYLDHGGDPNASFSDETSALDYATQTNRKWAIRLLARGGAKSLKSSTPSPSAAKRPPLKKSKPTKKTSGKRHGSLATRGRSQARSAKR